MCYIQFASRCISAWQWCKHFVLVMSQVTVWNTTGHATSRVSVTCPYVWPSFSWDTFRPIFLCIPYQPATDVWVTHPNNIPKASKWAPSDTSRKREADRHKSINAFLWNCTNYIQFQRQKSEWITHYRFHMRSHKAWPLDETDTKSIWLYMYLDYLVVKTSGFEFYFDFVIHIFFFHEHMLYIKRPPWQT